MTRAEAKIAGSLAILAAQLGGRITPGASLRGTALVDDGAIEVEITMVVRRKPTSEARVDHLTQAMIVFVTDHWRAEHCSHYIKGRRRGEWSLSKGGSCRMRPTHVVADRWHDGTVSYSFCCTTHAKRENSERTIAVLKIPEARLETARTEIKTRAELKSRLEKMTPAERIAEDARAAGRGDLVTTILATGSEP